MRRPAEPVANSPDDVVGQRCRNADKLAWLQLFPAVVAAAPAVGYRQHEGRNHERQMHADQPGKLGRVEGGAMLMKAFSTWIAETATIEAISFCLSPPKLTLVIHSGQSGWLPGSILETKFS
jgi:hypothetical protein